MRRKRPHQLIAAAFLSIGALLVYWSLDGGGWKQLMLWPAANCLAVGSAYFGLAGRVFGKRDDGTMRWWIVVLMLPFLLINWATWHAQIFFSRENVLDEIVPGLFLGRRAYERELPEAVTLIIDMTSEFPRLKYAPRRGYKSLPTLDAFVPEEGAFMELARQAASAEGGVFIHCANGHGRSAALAAAVLLLRGVAKDVAEAESMIVAARPACAWHPAQRALLQRLAAAGCK
ncbi:MAG: hypothetical protein ABIJ96_09210 [Elusimicrobiota bacterium]